MGFKDAFFNSLKFNVSDEDYDDELDYEEDTYEEDEDDEPKKRRFSFFSKGSSSYEDEEMEEEEEEPTPAPRTRVAPTPVETPVQRRNNNRTNSSKVVNMRSNNSFAAATLNEISMYKPKNDQDAKDAIDDLKAGKTIILNLDGLNSDLAQHIFDYVSGAGYCMGCNFDVISSAVYVFSPISVELTGVFGLSSSGKSTADDTRSTGTSSFRTKYDF